MAELNLTANGTEQERILAYLQENASDVLTEKINNGTPFEKDGKTLINKKTLDTFMKFAEEEVLKLIAENERKGRQVRCIEDATVFGWAIHYFEEDSIEGKLYNEDGTEYEPPKPVKKPTKSTTPVVPYKPPAPKPNPQVSLFDLIDEQNKPEEKPAAVVEETDEDDEQPTPEEVQEILAEIAEQEQEEKPAPKQGSPMYQRYMSIQAHYPDSIIAYRLGDFYEVFGSNAVTIAEELDLTLTGRDCGLDERVPMIGFPFHAADVYFAKIAANGHKLAVAEDLNTVREIAVDSSDTVIDAETGEVLSRVPNTTEPETDVLAREREIAKAFDKDALIKLSDLLGNIFTLE